MDSFDAPETLRKHRPLLLAMEAIGWLHMAGKANALFLREHGGQKSGYDELRWHEAKNSPFPWNDLLGWAKTDFPIDDNNKKSAWPDALTNFLTEHRNRSRGLLGLLQAAHGMASGIEKNLPGKPSEYLGQDATDMWLSSAFGHPQRNLLADPPATLTDEGWQRLVAEFTRILEELKQLGQSGCADDGRWWAWREGAIGTESLLRRAFGATLAETRLPNNDVTLWDQSYVAAALFKSAVAGAILEGTSFSCTDDSIKQTTRWRLLTVGIGADHYEARAVRIGDWTGARLAIDDFFRRVRTLIEVDLAVGSLLYADGDVHVFSFPGKEDKKRDARSDGRCAWLQRQIDGFAQDRSLETPPVCRISHPTRSLVPMKREIRKVRETLAIPLHRSWKIKGGADSGHVCPVCLVRLSGSANDKQAPCEPCKQRRRHRLDHWLEGKLGSDTIWISEVADGNDRLALLTMSLDIEPWLDGSRLDSMRTQSIAEWLLHNPKHNINPRIDGERPFETFVIYANDKVGKRFNKGDQVFRSLQEGFREYNDWEAFFAAIVEDRADAPSWDALNDDARARWLVHQLFVKLASPGRIYRFWRQTREFFTDLLSDFREISAADANRWRVRRLILKPDDNPKTAGWQDREVYNGRWRDAPISLLYRKESGAFLTACNVGRLLRADEPAEALRGANISVRGDDGVEQTLIVGKAEDAGPLGAYHPVIPLDVSPARFRVLMPLAAASAGVERAIAAWNEQFARVWDRLPLRVGLVAFPRMVPLQAVIEAARNVEHDLDDAPPERWRVADRDDRHSERALHLKRPDGGCKVRTMPVSLPDGRTDVFYPYFAVEDQQVRFPRDFQHPNGRVFRHALDLKAGDGIEVQRSRIATLFLDSTARRFDPIDIRPLAEWTRMRAVWRLLADTAPSLTALRGAWSELLERRQSWHGHDGAWLAGGEQAWLDLVRAVFSARLGAKGATLDHLVEAAADGSLAWALDWHLSVLKERLAEVAHAG